MKKFFTLGVLSFLALSSFGQSLESILNGSGQGYTWFGAYIHVDPAFVIETGY